MAGQGELPIEEFAEFSKEIIFHASVNDHPQIIKLLAATSSGGLVLERANCDLRTLCFANKGLPWRSKARMLRQGSMALAYLHSMGRVHQDVKPENFLMVGTKPENCVLKISDFGLAVLATASRSKTVRIGGGTLHYMAPEIYQGVPNTCESDVYSFGVLCYEVISGQWAYGGQQVNQYTIMKMKLDGEPPCQVRDQDCPPAALELIRSCCATDPKDRPTMEEVKNALMGLPEEWLFEEPIARQERSRGQDALYNVKIMCFLDAQLEKLEGLEVPATPQQAGFEEELGKGKHLLKKHADHFDIRDFYRTSDACHAVQEICGHLKDALQLWDLQEEVSLQDQIPMEDVEEDQELLHKLLNFVLRNVPCRIEETLMKRWKEIKARHVENMELVEVQFIDQGELQLNEELGEGSQGMVYAATWRICDVAVKKPNWRGDTGEEGDLPIMDFALYLREILFHDSVNGHPQIVKLLAVTFSGWIVMEKADCNLSTLCFAGEGLSWRSKARLLCQASTALAYLHSKSRVHKNVKLQNFLVSGTDPETCQLKISDFLLTVEQTASRSERVRIGDSGLSYTAPEFYDGNSTSFMSDVYGFGVLCHEVISGQKSYDGEGADHFAIMTKKLDGEPPCQVKGRDCPSAAMELMRRCCTSEPEIRPTMEQVKNALMQLPEQWVFGEQEQSRGQDALYNVKIMCFLDAQLEKLKGFEAPATPQQADFEEELGKGKHLLEKHANHFDIGDFCRTRDACHAVQEICGHLKDTLQLWDLQEEVNLQDQIPTEDVEEDQELLHKLLNFVLKDVPCSIEETLMKHWKEIKARHVESMKHVKVIGEGELQMGQLLGEGSRGTVYSAVWRSIDVVVKKPVWRGSMVGQGELPIEDFAEFSKEVISHASMNDHPQIVKLLAATTSGRMVLEKAKCDLHMLCFADEGLPWRSKVRLLRQGSTALAYLHSKGQVHRDIKLQNFLMFDTDPGTCLLKISDFGQDIMEIVSTVTKTVRISDGTLQYAAPEVYKGKPTSAKSDVYGFGVLCYEMVSGQKSYGGERANRYVIMKSKLNGKPPCQVQDRDCPPAVLELMRLCCAIDPADRPTMEEVKNRLMHLPGEWVFEEPIASEVQHRELPQASVLMYNQGMMGFLEEQLIKARAIQKPADKSAVQLNKYDHEVKKGERLLKKHQRFDIKGFYRIDDARRAVEAICSVLLLCLEEWGMQRSGTGMDLKSRIPQELVDGDKQHMYMLLAYVLKGQTLTSELRQDWEVVKADHEEALRGLKVISDEELQIGEKIGEGGYGSVYKAEWKSKTVAVKDVVPFHHYLSLEDFAAFFKEASIQALLTFHHVTPLYAITKSGRMVMELASCDLASLSQREQLPWPAKRRTLHQAALGLKHLHSRSPPLIHRDVKSSNFLIFGNDPDTWTVKVSDFGLTGECTKSVSKTVRGGGGTLEWMAPEVFLRKPLTLASDVFSMGVMMYEVVTGQHPYGVKSLDAKVREAVVTHEKSSENEPAKVQQGQCPQEMLDLMRRCISFDAKARPTIDEICEALATMGC